MELYKRFPKLTIICCCVEIVLYPGQIFGWSSLVFILKQEGFYVNLCEAFSALNKGTLLSLEESRATGDFNRTDSNPLINLFNRTNYLPQTESANGTLVDNIDFAVHGSDLLHWNHSENSLKQYELKKSDINGDIYTRKITNHVKQEAGRKAGCFSQDARLNLWFSIAVSFSYVMCAFLGPLIRKLGMRFFRLFFIVIYVIGTLCLGFASPVVPWLVCPGLCCIGIGGMALYSTNLQMSFLFPTVQSTITAFFVGLFDVSSVIPQLVKVAFENGISRRVSYVGLAVLHIALLGSSTLFVFPADRIDPRSTKKARKKEELKNKLEKETFLNGTVTEKKSENKLSLKKAILSSFFMLHVYWMAVKALRFVTFIGILNVWLESLFHGNKEKESQFLSNFSYITMGTIVSGLTAGLLHDTQRRKYLGDNDFRRKKMPVLIPFLVTTAISVGCTSATLVTHEAALYVSFVFFTIFRVIIYSYEVTYINDVFPLIYFTELYGIISAIAGLVGMLQYALFEWYEAYTGSSVHVNIALLILELTTLAHPFNIWYQCRLHRNDGKCMPFQQKSIHIEPDDSKKQLTDCQQTGDENTFPE